MDYNDIQSEEFDDSLIFYYIILSFADFITIQCSAAEDAKICKKKPKFEHFLCLNNVTRVD